MLERESHDQFALKKPFELEMTYPYVVRRLSKHLVRTL